MRILNESQSIERKMNASPDFSQAFSRTFLSAVEASNAEDRRRKRHGNPQSYDDADEEKVVPMKRKLYSRAEITQTIALEKLSLSALLQRS